MTQVIIGAPCYKRSWILNDWFRAIEKQTFSLSDLGFIFECGPDDPETIDCLVSFAARHPELVCFDIQINSSVEHTANPNGYRTWNPARYEVMSKLRNSLLDRAICLEPDLYFSLDTDILLEDPETIWELASLVLTREGDAVSPLIYMTPQGTEFPGVMTWIREIGGPACRRNPYPIGTLFQSDVIMAAVMMGSRAYRNTRYGVHRQGEDLYWSAHAGHQSLKLCCASYIYASHQMSESDLELYHKIGDPRSS